MVFQKHPHLRMRVSMHTYERSISEIIHNVSSTGDQFALNDEWRMTIKGSIRTNQKLGQNFPFCSQKEEIFITEKLQTHVHPVMC